MRPLRVLWARVTHYLAPGKWWDGRTTRREPTVELSSQGWRPTLMPDAQATNWLVGEIGDSTARLRDFDLANFEKSYQTEAPAVTASAVLVGVGVDPGDGGTFDSTALAVGSDASGATPVALASHDGRSWISVLGAMTGDLRAAAWCEPIARWLVVGLDRIYLRVRDLDSSGWTSILTPVSGAAWAAIASDTAPSEEVVIVGSGGAIASSTGVGAITWTARTSGTAQDLRGVCYGAGLYVAVGDNGAIVTSPDGIAWTVRDSGTAADLMFVAYDARARVFVAIGVDRSVRRSADGVTWSAGQAVPGDGTVLVAANDGQGSTLAFVRRNAIPAWAFAVGDFTGRAVSIDGGASWDVVGPRADLGGFTPWAAAFFFGGAIVVGERGNQRAVYQSAKL